ncbi:hypothetical protein TNCV_3502591 [Trichonephila clavipes]|uniref:Uncharacterized protein n=1 Tax=Trichonephila clavipes TaxID=2585209 RepID=A0A8X6VC13_TRICX|nr:hypothetical protein TNCV_3502591 [Trichonephila clavipes]
MDKESMKNPVSEVEFTINENEHKFSNDNSNYFHQCCSGGPLDDRDRRNAHPCSRGSTKIPSTRGFAS